MLVGNFPLFARFPLRIRARAISRNSRLRRSFMLLKLNRVLSCCGMAETVSGQNVQSLSAAVRSAQVVVPCSDLQATMDFLVERLGFRIDVIFPADAPATAILSGHGLTLRLEGTNGGASPPDLRLLVDLSALPPGTARQLQLPNGMRVQLVEANPGIEVPEGKQEFVISRAGTADAWGMGRASMQYRDLIPTRLGGRFVASHIIIPEGGMPPVATRKES